MLTHKYPVQASVHLGVFSHDGTRMVYSPLPSGGRRDKKRDGRKEEGPMKIRHFFCSCNKMAWFCTHYTYKQYVCFHTRLRTLYTSIQYPRKVPTGLYVLINFFLFKIIPQIVCTEVDILHILAFSNYDGGRGKVFYLAIYFYKRFSTRYEILLYSSLYCIYTKLHSTLAVQYYNSVTTVIRYIINCTHWIRLTYSTNYAVQY